MTGGVFEKGQEIFFISSGLSARHWNRERERYECTVVYNVIAAE